MIQRSMESNFRTMTLSLRSPFIPVFVVRTIGFTAGVKGTDESPDSRTSDRLFPLWRLQFAIVRLEGLASE